MFIVVLDRTKDEVIKTKEALSKIKDFAFVAERNIIIFKHLFLLSLFDVLLD